MTRKKIEEPLYVEASLKISKSDFVSLLEAQINKAKRRRREEAQLAIALPYVAYDDWYQAIAGPQLVTVFDPREPLPGLDRAVVGGSRIVKLRGR